MLSSLGIIGKHKHLKHIVDTSTQNGVVSLKDFLHCFLVKDTVVLTAPSVCLHWVHGVQKSLAQGKEASQEHFSCYRIHIWYKKLGLLEYWFKSALYLCNVFMAKVVVMQWLLMNLYLNCMCWNITLPQWFFFFSIWLSQSLTLACGIKS